MPRIADPQALLAYDGDPTGQIAIPVLTLHAIDDPTAAVENEAAYRDTVEHAGNARLLFQTFAREYVSAYRAAPFDSRSWPRTP